MASGQNGASLWSLKKSNSNSNKRQFFSELYIDAIKYQENKLLNGI